MVRLDNEQSWIFYGETTICCVRGIDRVRNMLYNYMQKVSILQKDKTPTM